MKYEINKQKEEIKFQIFAPFKKYKNWIIFLDFPPGADSRRLFPEDEIAQSFGIVCRQVPKQALISKKILEKHFSKFGRVVKVTVNPAKEAAAVHFDNHESARAAKENGLTITPKLPNIGAIFYAKGLVNFKAKTETAIFKPRRNYCGSPRTEPERVFHTY